MIPKLDFTRLVGRWQPVIEVVAFVCVLSIFGVVHLGKFVASEGYRPEYPILARFLIFIACVTLVILAVVLTRLEKFVPPLKDGLVRTTLSLFLALSSLYGGYVVIFVDRYSNALNYVVLAYGLIYVWPVWKQKCGGGGGARSKSYATAAIVFLALGLPFATSKHLNSESYPNVNEVGRVASLFSPLLANEVDEINIPLSSSEEDIVAANVEQLRLSSARNNIGFFEVKKIAGELNFGVIVDAQNLSALCLLGDYKSQLHEQENWGGLIECVNAVRILDVSSRDMVVKTIWKIPFLTNKISRLVASELGATNLENQLTLNSSAVNDHLKVMLVRGAFFHHYNSIAHTINSASGISNYFSNQYGFGPLFVAKMVSLAANIPVFDGIYLAVPIVNLVVAMLLLVALRNVPQVPARLIWLGFSASILVTYSISNMMAPFLYFIRVFPSVVICVMLFWSVIKGKALASDKRQMVLFLLVMLLVSIYNFEYAVLTAGAIAVAGFLLRNNFYCISGLVSIVASLVPKIVIHNNGKVGANYAAYLSGFGLDSIGALTWVFVVCSVIVGIGVLRESRSRRPLDELFVLCSVYVALCAKVVWMGSANHIGPLFMILSLILIANHSSDGWHRLEHNTSARVYVFLSVALLAVASIGSISFSHSKAFGTEQYVKTDISSLFVVSEEAAVRIAAFKDVYQKGDLVLSPVDNMLSLAVHQDLAAPYADISTNINFPVDLARVSGVYGSSEGHRVVVDMYVDNQASWRLVYKGLSRIPGSVRYGLNSYDRGLDDMRQVLVAIKAKGFYSCAGNGSFAVYCPPRSK